MQTSKKGLEEVFDYVAKRKDSLDYCNPSINLFRFIQQGEGICHRDFVLTRKELDQIKLEAEKFSRQYNVETKFGCSFSEQGCRVGIGKEVLTYRGEYIACSSLKDHEGEIKPGSFPCRERW